MDVHPGEVRLCCLLWALPGRREAMTRYEDAVLALVPEHGGRVLQREVSAKAGDPPDEVQLFWFPEQSALEGFMADPRRLALAPERDASVARTELFPVVER